MTPTIHIGAMNGAIVAVSGSMAAWILAKVTVATALGLIGVWLARRSRAAVRHALLAATFGILLVLPIVSLVAPPIHLALPIVAESWTGMPPLVAATDANPSATTTDAGVRVKPAIPQASRLSLSALLLAGWIAGTAFFLLPVVIGLWQARWLRGSGLPWLHGQSVVEGLAHDAGVHRRVKVLLHEALPGPMTCGVLHPAIVLPPDAQTWEAEALNRAIVHELEHVRRGDWVSQCLARAACAVYWFHPLVWIAWRKLELEAERACDDAVLGGAEATAYADQLVGLAKRLSTAHRSPLLAMANRADLATRVGAVLDGGQRRGRAGTFSVALACGAAVALVIAMSPLKLVAAPQSPAPWETAAGGKMAFEVASVKPTDSFPSPSFPLDAGDAFASMVDGQLGPPAGNRFSASMLLATYITFAYKLTLTQDQIQSMLAHLPKWVSTDRFEILARAAGNPTKDQMRLMMQSLLADRFKLAVHFKTHQAPVLALTLIKPGKLGPNLWSHADGPACDAPLAPPALASSANGDGVFPPLCNVYMMVGSANNRRKAGSRNTAMALLASNLPGFAGRGEGRLDRPVVDQTGLSGRFDFTLEWTPESSGPQPANANTDPQGPSFLEALREQLGLKLESTEAPIQTLVIDHIEKPDPN